MQYNLHDTCPETDRRRRRAEAGLNTAAKAAGLEYFGSATDNPELTDTDYVAGLSNTSDFGQITPGNSMKWDTIEPSRNTFSYDKGDVIADLAEKNGQKLRCHNLVWYQQLPSWVSSGNFDNATLVEILQNHITNEVKHYKGRCAHWDVVNEALADDGTFRDSVFYKTIGEAYIPIAFAAAAAADPDVKLYYNDYSIEWSGDKFKAAKKIVELVQSYGVKIDGVGLQAHFTVGNTVSQDAIEGVMKEFTAMGVEVAITELDIRTETPASEDTLKQQSTDYASIVSACVNVEGCVGITIWDYTDKYSWVPNTFSGYGEALPWDENLEKKPAYDGILNALQSGSSSSNTSPSASASSSTATGAVADAAASSSNSAAIATTAASSATAAKASSAAQVQTSSTAAAEAATTKATSAPAAPKATNLTTSAVAASSVSSASSASAAKPAASSPAAAAGSAAGAAGTVAKWGQCGGANHKGATACVSGAKCTKFNEWYSQCL
ncbi:carbohydrate-binding module family 1 protein [Aplosporella prunicola CBS 121167]|uniref:Beta-xylanase n=1 Tax=Aplosporella prunicola CBS 121167 TaxID=1176127 RepID=A0A6A6B890_9PEZI|nr:carbohydrate-binding module family 1 protein [Aplosporella prunicola CBS 121167]KAF2139001.1 carbohydrate-binding module family 1 protein [Aplosporella prunicola CBS 121167]